MGGKQPDTHSIWARVRRRWQSRLVECGLPQPHGGQAEGGVDGLLKSTEAVNLLTTVDRWMQVTTPGREVDNIAARARDGTWSVPERLLPDLLGDLRVWAATEFGSLEAEFTYDETWILRAWRL